MKIEEYLNLLKDKVNLSLKKVLSSDKNGLSDTINYTVFSGGKRLRPLLFLTTLNSLGGKINTFAMKIACAIEFIHTFSIIQDDLPSMDNDDYRRGKLTPHKVFGESSALLSSDMLLNKAYQLVAEDKKSHCALRIKILSELIKATQLLIDGQEKDLRITKKTKIGVEELNRIYLEKTGALITASIRIAGILKNINYVRLAHLNSFGSKLGLAYQILDDILNITGDTEAFKGKLLSDAKKGKITYLSIYNIENARKIAERLIQEAKKEINKIRLAKNKLTDLCDFILDRKY
jgi:geranylgeranyl diphosphate synthase type II